MDFCAAAQKSINSINVKKASLREADEGSRPDEAAAEYRTADRVAEEDRLSVADEETEDEGTEDDDDDAADEETADASAAKTAEEEEDEEAEEEKEEDEAAAVRAACACATTAATCVPTGVDQFF